VDSLDWKDYGVDSIIQTVTQHKHLGNGSIILCHNGAKELSFGCGGTADSGGVNKHYITVDI
jgi:hypothetical protein